MPNSRTKRAAGASQSRALLQNGVPELHGGLPRSKWASKLTMPSRRFFCLPDGRHPGNADAISCRPEHNGKAPRRFVPHTFDISTCATSVDRPLKQCRPHRSPIAFGTGMLATLSNAAGPAAAPVRAWLRQRRRRRRSDQHDADASASSASDVARGASAASAPRPDRYGLPNAHIDRWYHLPSAIDPCTAPACVQHERRDASYRAQNAIDFIERTFCAQRCTCNQRRRSADVQVDSLQAASSLDADDVAVFATRAIARREGALLTWSPDCCVAGCRRRGMCHAFSRMRRCSSHVRDQNRVEAGSRTRMAGPTGRIDQQCDARRTAPDFCQPSAA